MNLKPRTISKYLLAALLFTAFLNIFLNQPAFPAQGLDPSWGYAMNQALAEHLQFGKEIIFTFGPYHTIYDHQFHPATYNLHLLGSIYLSLCYSLALMLLSQNVKLRWGFCFWAMLVVLDHSDASLISYPLAASLVVFRTIFPHKNAGTIQLSPIHLFLIFSPLGLLPLIKGSLFIPCAAALVLSCAILLRGSKKNLAALITLSPVLSTIFFWTIANQQLANLPSYFSNMSEIISSYSEAMSYDIGSITDLPLFALGFALVLRTVLAQKSFAPFPRFMLAAITTTFFFICFKGGFIRHDIGHAALYCGASTLIAALLLPFIFPYKISKINVAPLPVIGVILFSFLAPTDFPSFSAAFTKIINQPQIFLSQDRNELTTEFDKKISEIKSAASFPILQGTSDIYPTNQSLLIASENKWSPRPVFQSYQASTAKLAQINADHLLGASAPDNIFFTVETIDGRFPALDDGLSWPILLQNYAPVKMLNHYLLLQKKSSEEEKKRENILSAEFKFGEVVEIQDHHQILFSEFEIKPTMIGKLVAVLFKPNQLQIDLTLNDGSKRNYRISSVMAESGFIISPLVENISEFQLLYDKKNRLQSKAVKSFVISERGDYKFLWQRNYKVTFGSLAR